MAIRFHLDESVATSLAQPLRQRGIDVTTPNDIFLLGAPDEEHLARAHGENRVVVTHDADYLRLNQTGAPHSGITYCHQSKYSFSELLQMKMSVDLGVRGAGVTY